MRSIIVAILIALTLQACVTTPDDTDAAAVDISPEMQAWLDKDCRAGLPSDLFIGCITVLAKQLPPIDPARREHFGEQYDPKEWLACMKRGYERSRMYGTGGCEQYRLRRLENPEYWSYPEVPTFKWPEAPKETVYRSGMSRTEYFEALCKAEAGEFIYKTLENVEGIYQIRPRAMEDDNPRQQDRYVLEDPFGYRKWESHDPYYRFLGARMSLTFFETPPVKVAPDTWTSLREYRHSSFGDIPGADVKVFRYSGYTGKLDSVRRDFDTRIKSRYGYTWRGITRPHDRKNAIAGGEIAVVDLTTNEIVALKRGFVFLGSARTGSGIRWESAQLCPDDQRDNFYFIQTFFQRVLNPANKEN